MTRRNLYGEKGQKGKFFVFSEEMALVEDVEGLPKVDVNIPLSDLVFEKKISKGGFGEVWKASYFGTDVAVKKMLRPDDSFIMRLIQREIAALKEVRHPNICLFLGVSLEDSQIHLVTEYIDGGTLWKLLKNRSKSFPWMARLNVAVEIAKAMTFLHAKNIAHRDLKSENVLLDKSMNPKICDFGLCRGDMDDTATKFLTKAGTETWMAPEIILGDPYSLKADVFSFGVVLYEIIVRDRPPDRSPMDAYQFEEETFGKLFPNDCPAELSALAISCVESVPEKRPAFKDVLVALKEIHTRMKDEAKAAKPQKAISKIPPPLVVAAELPLPIASTSPPLQSGLAANLMPPPPISSNGVQNKINFPNPAPAAQPPPPPTQEPEQPPATDPLKIKRKKKRAASDNEAMIPEISTDSLPPAANASQAPLMPSPVLPPPTSAHSSRTPPTSPRKVAAANLSLSPPLSNAPSSTSPVLPPPDHSSVFIIPAPVAGHDADATSKSQKSPARNVDRSPSPEHVDSLRTSRSKGTLASSTSKIRTARKARTPTKRRLSVEGLALEGAFTQALLPPHLDTSSAELPERSSPFFSLPPPPITSVSTGNSPLKTKKKTETASSELLPPPISDETTSRDITPSRKPKSKPAADGTISHKLKKSSKNAKDQKDESKLS